MRPSVTASYMNNFSAQTHTLFNTNASYMDVHSAANPSYMVDYDSSIPNAGKFSETLNKYRQVGTLARSIHNGPVSGEGLFHYLYTGYYDDFEAQINCGKVDGTSFQYFQGMRMPLMVDFKLNKMHVQTPLHGVGLYERFFSRTDGNTPFHQRTIDSSMMYMATELAYGNCAYIPEHDRTKNLIKLAKLEYNYVYPVQKYIYNACPVSIMYNDNGIMRTASEYITKYPATYDSITSPDFLSQVKVTYSNGVIVWANRNRFKQWVVSTPNTTGTISVHALLSLPDSCYYGPFSQTTFTLMAQSGWLVHLPASLSSEINDAVRSEGLAITCYPNPFTEETSILITAEKAENGFIKISSSGKAKL
jgi:hypothetical protein